MSYQLRIAQCLVFIISLLHCIYFIKNWLLLNQWIYYPYHRQRFLNRVVSLNIIYLYHKQAKQHISLAILAFIIILFLDFLIMNNYLLIVYFYYYHFNLIYFIILHF